MAYTLTVNEQELQAIAAGLNELPRKLSQPVFARIQAQVVEQDQAREEAEEKRVAQVRAEAEKEKAAGACPACTHSQHAGKVCGYDPYMEERSADSAAKRCECVG